MVTRRVVAVFVVVLAGCGAGRSVPAETAQPTVVRLTVAAQPAAPSTNPTELAAAPTAAPETTTTTTTTAVPVTVEPAMPYGARHGDQTEIVDEFADIATTEDCDALLERQAGYEEDEQAMLATRAEQGHRAKAEHDDRWAAAVKHRLVQLGCVDLAGTP